MRLLLEEPEIDIFDLDNYNIKELIKEEYTLLNLARAMLMDMSGPEYYDPGDDTFIEDEDAYPAHNLRYQYLAISLPSLHPHIIEKTYSQPVKCFQVLFEIYKDHLIKPCEVRINKDVRGKIVGICEIELSMSIKPERIYNTVFIPVKEDEKYSHITVLFNNEETFSIYCCLKLKNKEYGTYSDLLIPYTHLTEKQFLKYAKEEGYPVSPKSLRNYRSETYQRIFPEPFICKDPVTGIVKNYYDEAWIKYLKRIKELKEMMKKNHELYLKYDVRKLRDFDKHLGCNSFKDI